MNVITISGSLRKGSFNTALMRTLPALAPSNMTLIEAPSYASFPLYNADIQNAAGFPEDVKALAGSIGSADGVIIVCPEYNWSIPGAFKNALDWISRLENQPFKEKPVAIQSAAYGPLGGGRMQYHLRMALTYLNSFVYGTPEIFVASAHTKFDPKTLELTDEATKTIITQQLAGFQKFITRLAPK